MNRIRLIRDVPVKECGWLDADLIEGDILYMYAGCTYGCVAYGVPVTKEDGITPFFEIPKGSYEAL